MSCWAEAMPGGSPNFRQELLPAAMKMHAKADFACGIRMRSAKRSPPRQDVSVEVKLQIVSDASALARAAADVFIGAARQAVEKNGRFTVALSGGSTPKALYTLLIT